VKFAKKNSKFKINIVEKRLPILLPLNFKFKWTNTWHKHWNTKEVQLICTIWNKVVAINVWKAKVDCTICQCCPLCGDVEELHHTNLIGIA
jgi:hypothetical protein